MEAEAAARLTELLDSGAAVVVATRDDELVPHVTRGWGGTFDAADERLDLCLTVSPDLAVVSDIEAIAAFASIAVTVAHPTTYRAMQVTGTVEWIGDITPEDRSRIDAHIERFVAQVIPVGMPPDSGRIAGTAFIAVRVAIAQCFEQTPGAKAGSAL